jgi:GT2 family glycosyltransferase
MNRPSPITVSVVIVNWNARDYLRRCLRSLQVNGGSHCLEIIVVDNASTDGSAECVASEFPHVRLLVNHDNLGFAKGNNIGVAGSSGRYVCFINSDVEILPGCIDRLVQYCEGNPRVGMAGPLVLGSDGRLQRSCRGFPSVWNMLCRAHALDTVYPRVKRFTGNTLRHWSQDTLRPVDILTGCFWLVRRRAMDEVGLLDEAFFIYGEDMDWCRRFRDRGWPVVFIPEAQAVHHGGASSANAPVRFYLERHKADLQYWRKHHPPWAVAAYLLITCLHLTLRLCAHSLALLVDPGDPLERHKLRRSVAGLGWLVHARLRRGPSASA